MEFLDLPKNKATCFNSIGYVDFKEFMKEQKFTPPYRQSFVAWKEDFRITIDPW